MLVKLTGTMWDDWGYFGISYLYFFVRAREIVKSQMLIGIVLRHRNFLSNLDPRSSFLEHNFSVCQLTLKVVQ